MKAFNKLIAVLLTHVMILYDYIESALNTEHPTQEHKQD